MNFETEIKKHVMVDLETLGTTPGSVLLSIGAVAFDQLGVGGKADSFYTVVSTQSCLEAGLRVELATERWWMEQSPEARTVLEQARDPDFSSEGLTAALNNFTRWLARYDLSTVRLWGNGAAFDNVLLSEAYRKAGLEPPWKFWNDRCYRTIKALAPGVRFRRHGTYHNALDDAITQAQHLVQINKELGIHDLLS